MPRRRYAKTKKRYPQKRYKKKQYAKKKANKISTVTIRQPGVICADRYRVKLRYVDTTSNRVGSVGNSFGYIRYWANNLFDPNPLVFTTVVPGFKQLTTLYDRYRVRSTKLTVRCTNMEAFPVMVLIWPSFVDLTTSISNQFLQEMLANPYVKYKMLSPKGGMDRAQLSNYISWTKFSGTKNVSTDTDYSALVSTAPAQLFFFNIAAYSVDGANFTANTSVVYEARLTFYSEFYERNTLAS